MLAPKKLHDNWSVYTMNDTRNILEKDRFRYDVLNHTDLTRTSGMSGGMNIATVNWGNYDPVSYTHLMKTRLLREKRSLPIRKMMLMYT